jgi:hypothetical protein
MNQFSGQAAFKIILSQYIGAVYSRGKITSEPQKNIGKIKILSVAETSKDPRRFRNK